VTAVVHGAAKYIQAQIVVYQRLEMVRCVPTWDCRFHAVGATWPIWLNDLTTGWHFNWHVSENAVLDGKLPISTVIKCFCSWKNREGFQKL